MTLNYFRGAPVIINSSITLQGMTRADLNPNIGQIKPDTDGRTMKCIVTEGQSAPALEMSTMDVALALTSLSSGNELPFLALTDLKWYALLQDQNAPAAAAGTVHEQGHATAGTLFMTGLDCVANREAVMHLAAPLTSSDGSTIPYSYSQVTLPSDPGLIAPYTIDSVTIAGTTVNEVASISLRAAVDLQTEFGMKPYPRLARPRKVDWTLSVRHNNLSLERLIAEQGASIIVTLKPLATGGPTRGTPTMTWTVPGAVFRGTSSRPGAGNAALEHIAVGRFDGVNYPATWSVA